MYGYHYCCIRHSITCLEFRRELKVENKMTTCKLLPNSVYINRITIWALVVAFFFQETKTNATFLSWKKKFKWILPEHFSLIDSITMLSTSQLHHFFSVIMVTYHAFSKQKINVALNQRDNFNRIRKMILKNSSQFQKYS